MSSALRIVLDTNVLVSGIAYPGSVPGKIMAAWRHGSVEVVLSSFILDELRRVLPRLSDRHGLSQAEIDEFIDILWLEAEVLEPSVPASGTLRDPMDLPVLGTLIAGIQAGVHGAAIDYLITGDKDLLAIAADYPIVTPSEFWERHGDV